jgi:hypothetical protein
MAGLRRFTGQIHIACRNRPRRTTTSQLLFNESVRNEQLGKSLASRCLRKGDVSSIPECLANRIYQMGLHMCLVDKPQSAFRKTGFHKLLFSVDGEKNDFGRAAGFFYLVNGIDSIENRHGDIGNDDVRMES